MLNSKDKARSGGIRGIRLLLKDGIYFGEMQLGNVYEVQVTESNLNPKTSRSETIILQSKKLSSPAEVVTFMVALGVTPDEVAVAGQEMAKMDHNVAHFGVAKKFLFSEFKGYVS